MFCEIWNYAYNLKEPKLLLMSNRLIKQIIYGGFYLVFFALILTGGVFWILPEPTCFDNRRNQGETDVDCGGSCIDCALKNIQPISLFGTVEITPIDQASVGLFFQLQNPNLGYGAEKFNYTVHFYDSNDREIQSLSRESFIYPSQIKTVIEPIVKVSSKNVARIEVEITNPSWISSQQWSRPILQSRAVRIEILGSQGKISGLVLNNTSGLLSSVDVFAVLYGNDNSLAAVSKTVINDLKPFEERAFTIFVPISGKTVNTRATQVFVDAKR
ncbi:MAG: hypothetical protein AAB885_02810 [Patescibacteria group bacterium]